MQTEADPLCQPAASLYAEYEARQTLASQAHELSREDLRRTWSMVDILTSLKRSTSHSPTAALIRRKLDVGDHLRHLEFLDLVRKRTDPLLQGWRRRLRRREEGNADEEHGAAMIRHCL